MIYFLKHFKGIAYFLVMLSFSFISSCTEPIEEIVLPEVWENIAGEYHKGSLQYYNGPECTYGGSFISSPNPGCIVGNALMNSTIKRNGDLFIVEFQHNDTIPMPTLELEVISVDKFQIPLKILENTLYRKVTGSGGYNRFNKNIDGQISIVLIMEPINPVSDKYTYVHYSARKK